MKTKLNEFLKFPCLFTYKVVGMAQPTLLAQVREVLWRHAPGNYSSKVTPSRREKYHSISITIIATHIEQIEMLYEELGKIDIVRIVL
ncbi:DUF493 family protein YbeD [Candidatus Steffania adelgidicola]|uniref:DUF493 family protein YbeD n=1 Tax=Candidatus Steffania adelgidicola TaxID=1076626 RepID=UPI001D020EAF|nr:DUF493 family protein YbeD [Candidatus Steffania adelgidicola]UDG79791.1 hypothetical protein GFK82_00327 [Candidatus Steffania adelgidicola]